MNIIGSFILFIFSLTIFILLIIRYVKSVNNHDKSSNMLIIVLRVMTVIFLLFLILDLRFTWTSEDSKPSSIAVVFDMSNSVKINLLNHDLNIKGIKNKIDEWADLNKIEILYYGLGNELYFLDDLKHDENKFNFDDLTNFSKLNGSSQLKNHENILLISDGQATAGQNINEINFKKFPPMYCIGIGIEDFDDDLSIYGVDVITDNSLDDSLIVNLKIKSKLYSSHKTSFKITNSKDDIIYHDIVSIEKGDNIKELMVHLNRSDVTYYNIVEIDSIQGENNLINNKFPFLINETHKIKNMLLLSGALSSNTSIIKKHVNQMSNHKVNEYYRLSKDYWNSDPYRIDYSNIELIILDDFPIYNHDENMYNSLVDSSILHEIPVIMIQGPAMGLKSAEIINNKNNSFKAELSEVNELMHIDPNSIWGIRMDYDFTLIPPQKNLLKWESKDLPLIKFMDGSFLLANHENLYFLSLPGLSAIYYNNFLKGNLTIKDVLDKMILMAINKDHGLLKLVVNGSLFKTGEYVQNELIISDFYEFNNPYFYSFDGLDTLMLDCDNKMINNKVSCEHYYDKSGKYSLFASAKLNDDEMIFSNSVDILIDQNDIEMQNLVLNKQALSSISSQTGGIYIPIESIDSIFKEIDISPMKLAKTNMLSGISMQKFWWIIIILLCLEWYARKQKGLL